MLRRLAPPSSSPTESTVLTPGDRISNFPAPPSEDGDHDERNRTLPRVPMADAEARFAEWFTEVNKHLTQGAFDATTADIDAPSKPKQSQHAKRGIKRTRQPIAPKRTDTITNKQTTTKRKATMSLSATTMGVETTTKLRHPGHPPQAPEGATGKPSGRVTESARTRAFYARVAKRANNTPGNTVARNGRTLKTDLCATHQ